jgi:hypothetical protein
MNLEGGTNGLCGNTFGNYNQIDCSGGGDYVEVFDGRNAHAPSLSGHLTGDVTDGTNQARARIFTTKLPVFTHVTCPPMQIELCTTRTPALAVICSFVSSPTLGTMA